VISVIDSQLRRIQRTERSIGSGVRTIFTTDNEADSLDVADEQKSHWQLKAAASATRKLASSREKALVDHPFWRYRDGAF